MSDQREGGIAWTDQTWNPTRGCWPVSPGCSNCYAAAVAARFSGPGQPYAGLALHAPGKLPQWTGEGAFIPDHLFDPLRWTRPRRVFVNSMSDLFFEKFTDYQVAEIFAVMLLSPRHTFQVLTKRPERMLSVVRAPDFYENVLAYAGIIRAQRPELTQIGISNPSLLPAPWIWLGVSVEDRKHGLPRIDLLRQTPAAVRFLSIEPQLEDLGELDLTGIHWVIVGGESGYRARPFDIAWADSIVSQCRAAGVACFVKQLGSVPMASGHRFKLGHTKSADPAEWPERLRVQEFPGPVG